jgi:hypothetical protein
MFLIFRAPSPLPRGPHSMAAACANPIDSLPHTVFPTDYQHQYQQQYQPYQQPRQEQHVNYPPPPPPRSCFSPQLTRDQYQLTHDDENSAIQNQVSLRFITKVFASQLSTTTQTNILSLIINLHLVNAPSKVIGA